MAIATKNQYWNARMTGLNPASPGGNSNDSWSGSGGSAVDGSWVITNGTWSITPDADDNSLTLLACFTFATAPDNDAVILTLANGSHKIEIKSTGTMTGLKVVGATTVNFTDLDLGVSENDSVPIMLRLTLDSTGAAKCYRYEIIENDDAVDDFISLTAASSGTNTVSWGNTSGNVKWHSVYYSRFGAFDPRELMGADFAQDIHVRMALGIVDHLQKSNKPFLKTQVNDANIVYAYDLSASNVRKLGTPFVHVYLENISSPEFDALSGSSVQQMYSVDIFVTTKGTNYENAYMSGLNIMGEIFDELYTSTGLNGTTDSLDSHEATLDTRVDDDDIICTHRLTLTYRRRIKMTRR
tara:strand:+ start:259 stop:1320 length:1062 start_codon:yes stop_codon:yes gene_type:complete